MRNQALLNHFRLAPIVLVKASHAIVCMNTGYFHHLERCCIILLVHGLNWILVLISIFAFLVVMHYKFGVLALSERWIQCICKKRIMLNKSRAVNFFEGSKSVKVENIFLLNPVIPKI